MIQLHNRKVSKDCFDQIVSCSSGSQQGTNALQYLLLKYTSRLIHALGTILEVGSLGMESCTVLWPVALQSWHHFNTRLQKVIFVLQGKTSF